MKTTVIKKVNYKGRVISVLEDAIGQIYAIVDNNTNVDFHSVQDAKRFINGEPLKYYSESFIRFYKLW